MIDKFFRDKHGRVVVWQNPNPPLWTWAAAWALTQLLPYGTLGFIASLVAFGASFTWAWLEILQGASYFRRTLGVIVMIYVIMSRIR